MHFQSIFLIFILTNNRIKMEKISDEDMDKKLVVFRQGVFRTELRSWQPVKTNISCEHEGLKITSSFPYRYFECKTDYENLFYYYEQCSSIRYTFYETMQGCALTIGGGIVTCVIPKRICPNNILGATPFPGCLKPNYYLVCLKKSVHICKCRNNEIFDKEELRCIEKSTIITSVTRNTLVTSINNATEIGNGVETSTSMLGTRISGIYQPITMLTTIAKIEETVVSTPFTEITESPAEVSSKQESTAHTIPSTYSVPTISSIPDDLSIPLTIALDELPTALTISTVTTIVESSNQQTVSLTYTTAATQEIPNTIQTIEPSSMGQITLSAERSTISSVIPAETTTPVLRIQCPNCSELSTISTETSTSEYSEDLTTEKSSTIIEITTEALEEISSELVRTMLTIVPETSSTLAEINTVATATTAESASTSLEIELDSLSTTESPRAASTKTTQLESRAESATSGLFTNPTIQQFDTIRSSTEISVETSTEEYSEYLTTQKPSIIIKTTTGSLEAISSELAGNMLTNLPETSITLTEFNTILTTSIAESASASLEIELESFPTTESPQAASTRDFGTVAIGAVVSAEATTSEFSENLTTHKSSLVDETTTRAVEEISSTISRTMLTNFPKTSTKLTEFHTISTTNIADSASTSLEIEPDSLFITESPRIISTKTAEWESAATSQGSGLFTEPTVQQFGTIATSIIVPAETSTHEYSENLTTQKSSTIIKTTTEALEEISSELSGTMFTNLPKTTITLTTFNTLPTTSITERASTALEIEPNSLFTTESPRAASTKTTQWKRIAASETSGLFTESTIQQFNDITSEITTVTKEFETFSSNVPDTYITAATFKPLNLLSKNTAETALSFARSTTLEETRSSLTTEETISQITQAEVDQLDETPSTVSEANQIDLAGTKYESSTSISTEVSPRYSNEIDYGTSSSATSNVPFKEISTLFTEVYGLQTREILTTVPLTPEYLTLETITEAELVPTTTQLNTSTIPSINLKTTHFTSNHYPTDTEGLFLSSLKYQNTMTSPTSFANRAIPSTIQVLETFASAITEATIQPITVKEDASLPFTENTVISTILPSKAPIVDLQTTSYNTESNTANTTFTKSMKNTTPSKNIEPPHITSTERVRIEISPITSTRFPKPTINNDEVEKLIIKGVICPRSGKFRHRNSCKKYYYCDEIGNYNVFIKSRIMECHHCTQFNAELEMCDYPENVDECHRDNYDRDRTCTGIGKYAIPFEEDCTKYYDCSRKDHNGIIQLHVKHCPMHMVFDHDREACIKSHRCIRNHAWIPKCEIVNYVFADTYNCNKYYYCNEKRQLIQLECAHGYVFNGRECEVKLHGECNLDLTNEYLIK